MKKEGGLASLSVVAGIVMMSMLFSFSVMQFGMAETKKKQNLIVKGIEKANAKASLDCAVAVFEKKELDPETLNVSEFNECKIPEETQFSLAPIKSAETTTHWTLTASYGSSKANVLIASGKIDFAVFKTAGSLEILGGYKWEAATGDILTVDGVDYVECRVIVAGGTVTIDVQKSDANFTTYAPNSKYACAPTYSTVIQKGTQPTSDGFDLDILSNQGGMDIFQDYFGVPKKDWEKIRDKFDIVITTGSAIEEKTAVSNCGTTITSAIGEGNTLIWVDGDCLLDGLGHSNVGNASPLIVIKNGIIGLNATLEGFKGSFFQFVFDYPSENFSRSWGPQPGGTCKEGAMQNICLQLVNVWKDTPENWEQLPIYFYGSLLMEGSYLIDLPDSKVYINGAFVAAYDEGLEDNPILNSPPKVLKGSYHDF